MRPRLLDWYCGQGGAAKGYVDANFQVIGMDHVPQPHYPYPMFVVDCMEPPQLLLDWADVHHASPPCQFGSEVTPIDKRGRHPNLIPMTRELLRATGKPYTMENVRRVSAKHFIDPVYLTGTMFDMHVVDSRGRRFDLSRTRGFETNWPLTAPWDIGPLHPVANVFGNHFRVRSGEFRTEGGTDRTVDLPGEDRAALARDLMEMPWATMAGMSEAVPPPFCEEIGRQLLAHLKRRGPN